MIKYQFIMVHLALFTVAITFKPKINQLGVNSEGIPNSIQL